MPYAQLITSVHIDEHCFTSNLYNACCQILVVLKCSFGANKIIKPSLCLVHINERATLYMSVIYAYAENTVFTSLNTPISLIHSYINNNIKKCSCS